MFWCYFCGGDGEFFPYNELRDAIYRIACHTHILLHAVYRMPPCKAISVSFPPCVWQWGILCSLIVRLSGMELLDRPIVQHTPLQDRVVETVESTVWGVEASLRNGMYVRKFRENIEEKEVSSSEMSAYFSANLKRSGRNERFLRTLSLLQLTATRADQDVQASCCC